MLNNALESWGKAIDGCLLLEQGYSTLGIKKQFVSSLHNAVELILKQIMLDNGDTTVTTIKGVNSLTKAQLIYDYFNSTDLNSFFSNLNEADIDLFYSIEFSQLMDKANKLTSTAYKSRSIKEALKLLQQLRNSETHFIFGQSYLSDSEFVVLHNLMIEIDEIMVEHGYVGEEIDFWDENWEYRFRKNPLNNTFSYKAALKAQSLTNQIIKEIDGDAEYASRYASAFSLTMAIISNNPSWYPSFDRIWDTISLFEEYKALSVKTTTYDLPDDGPIPSGPLVIDEIEINF